MSDCKHPADSQQFDGHSWRCGICQERMSDTNAPTTATGDETFGLDLALARQSDRDPRLFIGLYPTGVVYADSYVERAGDYKRLAYLSYRTLELEVERDCPRKLAEEVRAHAAELQARRGEHLQVTTFGQTVLLGSE